MLSRKFGEDFGQITQSLLQLQLRDLVHLHVEPLAAFCQANGEPGQLGGGDPFLGQCFTWVLRRYKAIDKVLGVSYDGHDVDILELLRIIKCGMVRDLVVSLPCWGQQGIGHGQERCMGRDEA